MPSWSKRVDLAVDGADGVAGLGGALGRRLPEEDDRTDQLVGALPRSRVPASVIWCQSSVGSTRGRAGISRTPCL